jgi:hypothetical protein
LKEAALEQEFVRAVREAEQAGIDVAAIREYVETLEVKTAVMAEQPVNSAIKWRIWHDGTYRAFRYINGPGRAPQMIASVRLIGGSNYRITVGNHETNYHAADEKDAKGEAERLYREGID